MKNKPALQRGILTKYLLMYVLALLIMHLLTVALTRNNPELATKTWAVWFDLDREYNVPTVSNALLLASSAFIPLLLALRATHMVQRMGWGLFCVLFGYLSLDEILIIHEQLAEPTRKLLDIGNSNPLYHAWVVPAIFIVLGLGLIILVIKRYFKQLTVFADVLKYVVVLASGVVILEIIGTFVYNNTDVYRFLMVPAEEIYELSMAVLILNQLVLRLKLRQSNGQA